MIHSASPQTGPAVIVAWFRNVEMDGRTICVKIVITTDRDCGRPLGSRKGINFFSFFFYPLLMWEFSGSIIHICQNSGCSERIGEKSHMGLIQKQDCSNAFYNVKNKILPW